MLDTVSILTYKSRDAAKEVEMKQAESSEHSIRVLFEEFVDGWNAANGEAVASVFTENADFTAITGLHVRGRDQIARGHNEILSTIYSGTTLGARVESIHYLRPDVALVDAKFMLRKDGDSFFPDVPHTSAGIVATCEDGRWAIAVFRNMVPFNRPAAGPLERELTGARTPE
jgi:uncharacterized protein (TIGR02246 family)